MRLFTGIAPAPNVLERLSAILSELKPAARINWSPVENLHITCRFIGAWPENRLSEMKTALEGVQADAPVPVEIYGIEYLPNPRRPYSLVAVVKAGAGLAGLANAIDGALAPLGYTPETRAYRPHITLARIKARADLTALRERIAGIDDLDFGCFDVREFHLYSSQPAPGGSVYTKLAAYDLMREKIGIS